MTYDSQSTENVRVTHNDPNAPWPQRKAGSETSAMIVHAVEMRGCDVVSYHIERRRPPACGMMSSSSSSRRPHRRSKAA